MQEDLVGHRAAFVEGRGKEQVVFQGWKAFGCKGASVDPGDAGAACGICHSAAHWS